MKRCGKDVQPGLIFRLLVKHYAALQRYTCTSEGLSETAKRAGELSATAGASHTRMGLQRKCIGPSAFSPHRFIFALPSFPAREGPKSSPVPFGGVVLVLHTTPFL